MTLETTQLLISAGFDSSKRPAALKALEDGPDFGSQVTEAASGVISTGSSLVSDFKWTREHSRIQKAEAGTSYYLLGQWAVTGDSAPMLELVRRALHRDGTTAALTEGMQAVSLLSMADDASAERLAEFGFNRLEIATGDYPDTLALQSHLEKRTVQPAAPTIPVVPAVVVPAAPAPVLPVGDVVFPSTRAVKPAAADLATGKVALAAQFFGGGLSGVTLVPPKSALDFIESLTSAVRSLLLPAEGYVWDDEAFSKESSSRLLLLDPYFSDGLSPVAVNGPFLQAEVAQISPMQPGYTATVFDRQGGRSSLGPFDDFSDAKAAVAAAVRKQISALVAAGQSKFSTLVTG